MSNDSGPQDTWEMGAQEAAAALAQAPPAAAAQPSGAKTAEAKPAGDKPPRRRRRRHTDAVLTPDDKAEAVSQDIALAIDGITEHISGIQNGLARKVTHMSVDAQAWSHGLVQLLRKVFAVPLTFVLQIFLVPLRFFNGLLGRVSPDGDDYEDEEGVDWDEEMAADEEPAEVFVDFNDMLEKNIIFLDNTKRPLFSNAQAGMGGRFGKQVMALYMELSLSAIRECAPLTSGMPPVEKGRFQGRNLEELMVEVSPDDLWRFFTFACKFAASYSGKNFRLSETYATWLMNGAPIK
jgi:hypothetical protein